MVLRGKMTLKHFLLLLFLILCLFCFCFFVFKASFCDLERCCHKEALESGSDMHETILFIFSFSLFWH